MTDFVCSELLLCEKKETKHHRINKRFVNKNCISW
jgi:hypothetical protein